MLGCNMFCTVSRFLPLPSILCNAGIPSGAPFVVTLVWSVWRTSLGLSNDRSTKCCPPVLLEFSTAGPLVMCTMSACLRHTQQKKENGYCETLLSISPIENKTLQLAQEHHGFLKFVLLVYNRSLSYVVSIVGDYASANRVFAWLIILIYIGSYLHLFSCAVKEFISDHQLVFDRIQRLMRKLSSFILFAQLQRLTSLSPRLADITRWSSTFYMLKRYYELEKHIFDINATKCIMFCYARKKPLSLDHCCVDLGTQTQSQGNFRLHQQRCWRQNYTWRCERDVYEIEELIIARQSMVVNPVLEDTMLEMQDSNKLFLRPIEEQSIQNLNGSDINRQPRSPLQHLSFANWLLAKSKQEFDHLQLKYWDRPFILQASN